MSDEKKRKAPVKPVLRVVRRVDYVGWSGEPVTRYDVEGVGGVFHLYVPPGAAPIRVGDALRLVRG